MGASFLITLREGLEIAIVLAILVSYLVKSGRRESVVAVWRGAGLAAGLCIVLGIVVHTAVGGLNGKVEKATEGAIAVAAAGVLTWMIFWMRNHARSMGTELRQRVDAATTAGALVTIAFVAVVREGLETVLFLMSADTQTASTGQVVFGGLAGLVVAALLGRLVYAGGNRLNLRTFFNVTGILLIFFAAGLVGKAFHEFREFFGFESGWLVSPAWTVTDGVWAEGTFYDFMKGFFGWHNTTEKIRLIAYFAYLVPVGWLFVRGSRTTGPVEAEQSRELAGAARV